MLYVTYNERGLPELRGQSDEEVLKAFAAMQPVNVPPPTMKFVQAKNTDLTPEEIERKRLAREKFNSQGGNPERAKRILSETREFMRPADLYARIEDEREAEAASSEEPYLRDPSKVSSLRTSLHSKPKTFIQLEDGRWGLVGWHIPPGAVLKTKKTNP